MRISDWSSDVCSSDLPRRSCARSRVAMRHPASPEISGFFRSWHVLPTFLRSRLMAVRHACRDTAPAENPCAACQSDLSVDRRFFVDTGLAELTGLFVTIVLIVEFEIEITARDLVLAQPKRFITHPVRRAIIRQLGIGLVHLAAEL